MCSKLTVKTATCCSGVSLVNFEQVLANWVNIYWLCHLHGLWVCYSPNFQSQRFHNFKFQSVQICFLCQINRKNDASAFLEVQNFNMGINCNLKYYFQEREAIALQFHNLKDEMNRFRGQERWECLYISVMGAFI